MEDRQRGCGLAARPGGTPSRAAGCQIPPRWPSATRADRRSCLCKSSLSAVAPWSSQRSSIWQQRFWGSSSSTREQAAALEELPDPRPPADVALERRWNAKLLWLQVKDLPLRQRQALLLNLKDDAIRLFVLTGTGSLAAIADALEMSVKDLASLWNELPLPDNAIATKLGCTRQQVINLRMAARKRLANRLSGWS